MKTLLPVIALTLSLAAWSMPQALADDSSSTTTTTSDSSSTTTKKHHHHKKCCNKDKTCTSTNSASSQ